MSGFVTTEIRLDRDHILESTLFNPEEDGDIIKLYGSYYRIIKKYSYSTYVNQAFVEKVSYLDFLLKKYPNILTLKHPFFDKINAIEYNPEIS